MEGRGVIPSLLLLLDNMKVSRDWLNVEILTARETETHRQSEREEQEEKGNRDGGPQGLFFFLEKVNNVIVDLISRFWMC